MIKILVEATCDFCRKEIKKYEFHHINGSADRNYSGDIKTIGMHHACPECIDKSIKFLMHKTD